MCVTQIPKGSLLRNIQINNANLGGHAIGWENATTRPARTKIASHTNLICVKRRRKFNLQALGWRSRAIRPYGGETNDTNVKCTRRRSTLRPRRRTISNAAEHSRTMFRLVNKLHASDVRVCSIYTYCICACFCNSRIQLNVEYGRFQSAALLSD
jgi:hypothetical protein